MIKKLPAIYPNESVYSWLARGYSQSGFLFNKYYLKEIFINPDERIDYNFINLFNDSFKKIIKDSIGFEELLMEHTLFKHYVRFMDPDERIKVFESGTNNSLLLNKKVHVAHSKKNYFLRYCPCCVEEDRSKYGECYFHVEHQIYEIKVCPKHNVCLVDTKIKNDKDSDVTFVTLEQIEPKTSTVIRPPEDINVEVMKYISKVFKEKLVIENKTLVSDYLTSKLNRSQCVDNACTKKNIIKLVNDISLFYKDLVVKNFKPHRVCDVYRGKNINPYDVLLVCYFHHIEPAELSDMKLNKEDIKRPIIRRVIDLYKVGYGANAIASTVGRSEEQVIRIINGYKKVKMKSRNHRYQ